MTTILQSTSTSTIKTLNKSPIKLSSTSNTVNSIASSSSASSFPSTSTSSTSITSSLCSHLNNAVNASGSTLQDHLQLGSKWALELTKSKSINLTTSTSTVIEIKNGKKRRKTEPPCCSKCSISLSRPMLCLDCGVVLCGNSEGKNHAKAHSISTGHGLVYDLRSSSIYCLSCDDYVYHPLLDDLQSEDKFDFHLDKSTSANEAKRQRLPLVPLPSSSSSFSLLPDSIIPRGLRNLGNSCYMSVILQSFLHNPLLRAYFLSDKHNRFLCPVSSITVGIDGKEISNVKDGESKPCLGCEMDRLFEECYASDSTPFGPINFLHSMWQASPELSGYVQHDASEFLISSLNLLHTSSPNHTNNSTSCKCIVHSTFSGQLRSEVICGACKNVTRSDEIFLDLSLDLRVRNNLVLGGEGNTLRGCLGRFTSRESLPAKEYNCTACGDATQVASKQLSIKKLPPVLCIQLKRFEHGNGAHKIDTAVKFPLNLNMRPYTSFALSESKDVESEEIEDDSMFEYELFSVINHEGLTISNGHYTNYCRSQEDFYCFDDEKVKRSPLSAVLGSQSYLLSYVRKKLHFSKVV